MEYKITIIVSDGKSDIARNYKYDSDESVIELADFNEEVVDIINTFEETQNG